MGSCFLSVILTSKKCTDRSVRATGARSGVADFAVSGFEVFGEEAIDLKEAFAGEG